MSDPIAILEKSSRQIDVSIVMPCLNEASCLAACIVNAREALERMYTEFGLSGEIIVADNGSTDGSQLIARAHGARVVDIERRGYGAAIVGGFDAALGRFLVMGDADGSYDFIDSVAMIDRLIDGADLCIGSRFKGGIAPGAMPWKNRYIGNPVLTGILNLFFSSGVGDAHCGLRAIRKDAYEDLGLRGSGMEFASEMVIKASLKKLHIDEVPVKLLPDLRDRPPHLRPWRDGWRHLRYLLMLSPAWAFAVPALVAAICSLTIWSAAAVAALRGEWTMSPFGNYWVILAGALLGLAHIAGLLAISIHLYGRRQGYRPVHAWEAFFAGWISLESMLLAGVAAFGLGSVILLFVLGYWSQHGFGPIGSVLPAVVGTTTLVIGAQNALGGFMLAVVSGNEAEFLRQASNPPAAHFEAATAAKGTRAARRAA